MNRVQLQGRAATLRDQQRAVTARSSCYGVVDFNTLRVTLNARVFVGPALPLHMRAEFKPDVVAERSRVRHWQLVAEFERYGYPELKQRGTPYVGDAFGYGQSNEVHA